MYLEISPRQTGKTTRLIEAVKLYLEEQSDHHAIIMVHNMGMVKIMKNRLQELNVDPYRITVRVDFPISISGKMFYDEFDFCKERNVIEDENAYYCTTASKQRSLDENDTFMRLIKINGGYMTYLTTQRYKTALLCLGEENVRLEYKNEFIDWKKDESRKVIEQLMDVDDKRCGPDKGLLNKHLGQGKFADPEGIERLGAIFKRSEQYVFDESDKTALEELGNEIAIDIDAMQKTIPVPYVNILIGLYREDEELQNRVEAVHFSQHPEDRAMQEILYEGREDVTVNEPNMKILMKED